MARPIADLTGEKFGRLTVIEFSHLQTKKLNGEPTSQGIPYWKCECECGTIKTIRGVSLKNKYTVSCGCYNAEKARTHGMEGTKIYNVWASMKQRCQNPKHKRYADYGGRGITVCDEWQAFENFFADMGGAPEGLEIDRKDNDGNYEKGNCRWVTPLQNCLNRTRH